MNCINRYYCLPEGEFGQLNAVGEKFIHRDFLYFEKNNYMFEAGATADGIFNIFVGNVKIFGADKNGKAIVLTNAGDGDSIGFNSIVDGYYVNSAYAIEDVFCCFIKISEAQFLVGNQEPIAQKILMGY